MNLEQAKQTVAKSIAGHTRMIRLISSDPYDYDSDAKKDSWDYEDQRDATLGKCGYPWEKEQTSGWNDSISKDAHFHIAQVALGMVETLAGSWRDTSATEFAEFLNECGLDREWVAKFIPEGSPAESVLGY